jgi:ribosome-associated protein
MRDDEFFQDEAVSDGQDLDDPNWDDQKREDQEWNDEARKSKSQRKRELQALLELTEKALSLTDEKLAATGIDEKALLAFKEAKKMKASGAKNRQLKYISKLIRNDDIEVLEKYLDEAEQSHLNEKRFFHQLERWRDRLIAEGDNAINECLNEFTALDRQQLRTLVRQAKKELETNKPPVASRKIFKLLREMAEKQS